MGSFPFAPEPPVTLDDVCRALDSAGFDELDDFPIVDGLRGVYLLVSLSDLRLVDMHGRFHYVGADEHGIVRTGGCTIDNTVLLAQVVRSWAGTA